MAQIDIDTLRDELILALVAQVEAIMQLHSVIDTAILSRDVGERLQRQQSRALEGLEHGFRALKTLRLDADIDVPLAMVREVRRVYDDAS